MTVSTSTSFASYAGNGSLTTFAYAFKIFEDSDLLVTLVNDATGVETTQTLTTNYTVTGAGNDAGGNVVFVTAPASGVTIKIRRVLPVTQETDYVPNDPFPAEAHEDALDKLTMLVQQANVGSDLAISFPEGDVGEGSNNILPSAVDRAGKVFAFDSSGGVAITQEIGEFKGNWSASTSYAVRDLVKDTSTNNIFLANTAHTSSGSQPITTNADSAKWDLIVDAASATSSASAAASSATDAETAQTAAEAAQAAAETAETNAETAETNAEAAQTAAEAAQASAEAVYDNFDDRYLGAKSTSGGDPTVDNDGDALIDGALFFDTTNNVMKVYNLGTTTWLRTTPTSAEQANIDAVAADASDIGTVATNIANVNTVAGISSDVTTVSGISSDVTAVVADEADIGTVATNIANVNTVGGISANVTTVAGISANVTTVAGISADVSTVAGDSADVTAVAADLGGSDNIGTVAGSISNVNAVGGDIANVNTAAANLSSINSFAQTYRIGATDPTTSLDEGDLFYNTTSNQMKVYNGSGWEAGVLAGAGTLLAENNLSDLDNKTTAQRNLGWYHSKTIAADEIAPSDAEVITGKNLVINDGATLTVPNTSRLEVRFYANGEIL